MTIKIIQRRNSCNSYASLLSLQLKTKRQVTKPKDVATEAALKEVKERAKAAKKSNALKVGAGSNVNIPKNQKFTSGTKGGRGSTR